MFEKIKGELGSHFILEDPTKLTGSDFLDYLKSLFGKKNFELINFARNAIRLVLDTYSDVNYWLLPQFTCESVIEPFIRAGKSVEFYPIGKDLRTSPEILLRYIASPKKTGIYLQSYFGDYGLEPLKLFLKGFDDIVLVEDATHSLLNEHSFFNADVFLGSIRKWDGMGEGAFIASDSDIGRIGDGNENIFSQWAEIRELQLRYDLYGNEADKVAYRGKVTEIIKELDNIATVFAGSSAEEIIVKLPYREIIKRRKANYNYLNEALKGIDEIKTVFYDMRGCPLYYPIYVEERERLQIDLARQNIYAPVIWEQPDAITADTSTRYIYEHILCLPIDQRYDESDMFRISDAIKKYYGLISKTK